MRTLLLTLVSTLPCQAFAQESQPDKAPPTDRELVEAAVEDYLLALYDAEPKRIERSVDRDLVKRGFHSREGKPYRDVSMSYAQLHELAGKWNAEKWLSKDAPRQILVLDVLPRVASAKLTAHWGTDYMQLVKGDDDRWRIRHVLWQSPPRTIEDQTHHDNRASIKKAATRYADAFYKGKVELHDGAVHPELAKYGFYRQAPSAPMQPMGMDFAQLKQLTKQVGGMFPPDSPKKVELLDVQDQTAALKLTGAWGIDYMHVARFGKAWQTIHIAWQSHPLPKAERAPASRLADCVNAKCPFSGDPVVATSLAIYGDKVVGFCNPDCRDKFVKSPARFAGRIPELAR